MKITTLLLLTAAISLTLTSCGNRPLTAQEQKALLVAEDTTLAGITGYATGGKAGAIIGATSALKRGLTAAKQPQNVTP